MQKLAIIAEKELKQENFNDEEINFLKGMLREPEQICGAPPIDGWFTDLFYDIDKMFKEDYVIADVHTQPTDSLTNMVGKILHVGTGKINLGIFLTESPSCDYAPMAFIGPFMSYYEKVTEDFFRMTDELWTLDVKGGLVPDRPSWTAVYLAGKNGELLPEGNKIQGSLYTGFDQPIKRDELVNNINIYPNPFTDKITFSIRGEYSGLFEIHIYDIHGRQVDVLNNKSLMANGSTVIWMPGQLLSGIYFAEIKTDSGSEVVKLILLR